MGTNEGDSNYQLTYTIRPQRRMTKRKPVIHRANNIHRQFSFFHIGVGKEQSSICGAQIKLKMA